MRLRLTICAVALVAGSLSAATLAPGFTETTLASGLSRATAFAIAPDGRVFICEQDGRLLVVKNGALLPTPFVTLTVSSVGERGLLGVAVDPDFLVNQHIYVHYTATTPSIHNRVSRFTASGDVAAPGSELFLLDLPPLGASNHNGGAIHFGRDGKLYIAVGENAVTAHSQDLTNPLGKVLRINKDGSVPPDNPFASPNDTRVWAYGLRNPFTFAVHQNTGRIFINDVGQSSFEEVNDGFAAANYGWPESEGNMGLQPGHTAPLHAYGRAVGQCVSGGAFYAPEIRQFPGQYVESYFFADLCSGWIKELRGAVDDRRDFADGAGAVDLRVAHDGSLYYLVYGGALRRVRWNTHLKGDVNNDGNTDGADVVYLIHHFTAGGPPPLQGGDVDGDNAVTPADLTYLTNYVFGRGNTPL